MKKGFTKGAWGSAFKKVAIATFALAALFMWGVTAVYANDVGAAAGEQDRGRIRTEREERILLLNGICENRIEFEQGRRSNRTNTEREERILLPSGIRESRTELEILRSGNRNRTEREERILLPSGIRENRGVRDESLCIRERMTELEFERSGNRTRSDRDQGVFVMACFVPVEVSRQSEIQSLLLP